MSCMMGCMTAFSLNSKPKFIRSKMGATPGAPTRNSCVEISFMKRSSLDSVSTLITVIFNSLALFSSKGIATYTS